MATVNQLKNELVDKILSIQNIELLKALNTLVSSTKSDFLKDNVELTVSQKAMLELSEKDIKEGNFISQEAVFKRNSEWLNEK